MKAKRRFRLDLERYGDPGSVWHVSAATRDRRPVFADPVMADIAVDAIRFQCAKASTDLLLYCVMPDHVHLVVTIGDMDLISIVRDFKSWTTHRWKQRTGNRYLWQESFHDHGVRRTEKMDELVSYIVSNPVDGGLVADWQDYHWLGGMLLEDDPPT